MRLFIKITGIGALLAMLSACAVYPAQPGYYPRAVVRSGPVVVQRHYFRPGPPVLIQRNFYGYRYPHHYHHFYGHGGRGGHNFH